MKINILAITAILHTEELLHCSQCDNDTCEDRG